MEEIFKLKDSEMLNKAENIYLVHIFNEKSKKHLPQEIQNKDFTEIENYVIQKLHRLTDDLLPGHHNRSEERHSHCIFNINEKIKILDYLKEIKADLVISPTQGKQGIEGIFKDSFCFWLVEHAPCDVFVIRPKQKN